MERDPLFDVRDQVMLVSGGSRGIGLGLALGFVERGARVVVTGREEEVLRGVVEKAAGMEGTLDWRVCDVRDREAVRTAVASIAERYGRIDTLVNCAGVNRRLPAECFEDDDFDAILDINLKGAWRMSMAVGEVMATAGRGSQIQITSLTNDRPLRHVAPYAMSKAALGQMTRALALEWGGRGIRVNALAPGFILTDLTRRLWSDPGMQAWGRANTPLERLGVPADLVGTAVFLAAPASAWMTGQIVYVDGGVSAGYNWPIPEGGGQSDPT